MVIEYAVEKQEGSLPVCSHRLHCHRQLDNEDDTGLRLAAG